MMIPAVLQTFTTDYSPTEDRIRISGRDKDDAVQVLWLTRRLADGLVRALAEGLAKRQDGVDHLSADLMQEFAQARAEAALEPTARVEASSSAAEWLIVEVDIQTADHAVALVFKSAPAQVAAGDTPARTAQIGFGLKELRQWLSIVLRAYRTGGWPLDVWPDWIAGTDTAASPGPAAHSALH